MSTSNPTDHVSGTASTSKKKNAKKKKATKNKVNGDASKAQEITLEAEQEVDEGEEEPVISGVTTPKEEPSPSTTEETKLPAADHPSNGHPLESNPAPADATPEASSETANDSLPSNASDSTDTSSRLEAMSQDREALRVEVEQLRRQLESLQVRHDGELGTVKAELQESEVAKEQAEENYQTLVKRVNGIRTTLGERMAADKRDLGEARDRIDELETQNQALQTAQQDTQSEVSRLNQALLTAQHEMESEVSRLNQASKMAQTDMESQVSRLLREAQEASKELSSLRNRHNLSQQNWAGEREELVAQRKHLKDESDAAKEAMSDWEVLAMEERSIREGLADRVAELEDQLSSQKESYERATADRDNQSQAVDGLQRALHDIQEARKVELREMVETTQDQLDALNKLVQQAEMRASEAASAKEGLEKELERAAPFEKEVREKNLLIGKLRHEAIVLNDHLTKALRFLKKAKPEDNIDRQIVTNHFLQFVALDRSDPKKFQILQIIAALLNWTEEQKEQAGLARPGGTGSSGGGGGVLGGSLRLPMSPFHRTPSTPSLPMHAAEIFPETPSTSKESLSELWTSFLERQAEEGQASAGAAPSSRKVSVSSPPLKLDTKG